MPAIDPQTVRDTAELARLELTAAEVGAAAARLGAVLDHFTRLAEVDTEGVQPTPYPLPIRAPMRSGAPGEPLPAAEVVAGAPAQRHGAFVVPRVVDA